MINIKILCIGKAKEVSLKNLIDEYKKRISKYCKIEIIELDDEKLPLNLNTSEEDRIKNIESKKMIDKINKLGKSKIIALDLNGNQLDSIQFSKKISYTSTYECSNIIFLIGGSLGMSKELISMADEKICFSKLTFPHQLIRLFLLEQIFRAFKIENNENYHH